MDESKEEAPQRSHYHVKVRNLGPIAEGNIELRPLTVFVGPSNTGKSYLAMMVYALHRYFAGGLDEFPYGRRWRNTSASGLKSKKGINLDPKVEEELDAWLKSSEEGKTPPLSEGIKGGIRSIVEEAAGMAGPLEREIIRCFGTETIDELIRRPRAHTAEVVVDLYQQSEKHSMQYRLEIGRDEHLKITGKVMDYETFFSSFMQSSEINPSMFHRYMMSYSGPLLSEFNPRLILGGLAYAAQNVSAKPLSRPAYYLPADRTGVMHSHKVVVSALVQSTTSGGLRPAANVPILSGVLADFLEQLIQMSTRPRFKKGRKGDSLASNMEESVLKGGVQIETSETNYPHFVYRPKGWKVKLPLMRSSSMVAELAPIVLYLRHIVRPGDILIIEEPESHLHPEMQVEVIRRLAEVVRSGIKVIVTTHSEWVLDELANMVLNSQIKEPKKTAPGEETACLHPHQVGAWLFKHRGNSEGVVVEELKTDDTGLYPSGFDRVAVAQHNRWAEVARKKEL